MLLFREFQANSNCLFISIGMVACSLGELIAIFRKILGVYKKNRASISPFDKTSAPDKGSAKGIDSSLGHTVLFMA